MFDCIDTKENRQCSAAQWTGNNEEDFEILLSSLTLEYDICIDGDILTVNTCSEKSYQLQPSDVLVLRYGGVVLGSASQGFSNRQPGLSLFSASEFQNRFICI